MKTNNDGQNAAESLPAAPEHCSGCLHPDGHNGETHCYGTIEHPEPDAPVEAKEKELCSSKTSDGLPCNALGDHEIHTHTREGRSDPSILWRDTPIPVAEPKPTPSTEPLTCPHGVGRCVCRICNGINWDQLKPRPDSSSIPDLKLWLDQAVDLLNLYHSGYCPKDVAKDFLEKCKLNFGNVAEYKPFVDSSIENNEAQP